MKEVKEQCEERIEEVTKRGNEAVASRDLSEKKDQSQQVILGFFCPGFWKAFLPSLQAFCSLVCCLICSSLCSLRLFGSLQHASQSRDAATLAGQTGLWPCPWARGFTGVSSFKVSSHPARELLLFCFEGPETRGQGSVQWPPHQLVSAGADESPRWQGV